MGDGRCYSNIILDKRLQWGELTLSETMRELNKLDV
jgi:hypothetical protein